MAFALRHQFLQSDYAATTEAAFDIDEEDIIVFPIDRRSGEFSGADGADEFYSGALFTVEGEGIERVQATLSRGEIYSYEVEDFLVADNPEKAAEASAWASKLVGTGKYYKDYDAVARIGNPDARETDPYAHVRMLKRLGSTIDVPIEEGSPNCWGLWLDVDSVANAELHEKIRDAFVDLEAMEGETLTVTAQMADGTFQTQVIELHVGWFKGESVTGVMGLADVLPTGKPVSFDEVTPDGNFVHALYGTLQSASNTPHPYSLADANRYANEVAPTKGGIENVLEFQGTTTALEGVPEPETAADADGIVVRRMTIYDGARSRENREVAVRLSGLRCEVTDKLPGCFDLHEDTELTGFSGNLEYMNKCRMITSHYAVDEKGVLNEGNSFVIVEYDLLNEGDEEIFIGTPVGALCAVDEPGDQTVFATSGVFGAIDTGWHDTANGDCALRGVWLKPDEANHVTVAFVAEDSVAHAEKLALMVSPDESFLRYGYEGELPNVHDLQFVWLRS